jgi:hypothetical protein
MEAHRGRIEMPAGVGIGFGENTRKNGRSRDGLQEEVVAAAGVRQLPECGRGARVWRGGRRVQLKEAVVDRSVILGVRRVPVDGKNLFSVGL